MSWPGGAAPLAQCTIRLVTASSGAVITVAWLTGYLARL
jgi:hypothetical protein